MSKHVSDSDSYYVFDQCYLMNVSNDDVNEQPESFEIKHCIIEKDLATIQLVSDKRNRLLVQTFPPTLELTLFQPDLKKGGEVVFADDQLIFVYLPHKKSLEVLQDKAKIGFINGRLKNKKVVKCEDRGIYLLSVDDKIVEVSLNPLTLTVEANPVDLDFTQIYDFTYQEKVLYVIGKTEQANEITILKRMTGGLDEKFYTKLIAEKLQFLKADSKECFILYDKINIYCLKKAADSNLEIDKQFLIPLTPSSMIKSALILEDKHILVQDDSNHINIFSDREPNRSLLLQDKPVSGPLAIHGKDIYIAEHDNGILQFYKMQKISLIEYARQYNNFSELRPMKNFWLSTPETTDMFYKSYIKDNIDEIQDISKVMKKIKSIQIKINLMQELAPADYEKLDKYINQLKEDIENTENPLTKAAQMKTIDEQKKRLDLFMSLSNGKYTRDEYVGYKQKNILDLISQHVQNAKLVGLICSVYVNETRSYYEKILERVIESELEEASKEPGENYIENLLPLGSSYERILQSGEQGEITTFVEYWNGVRGQMKPKGFSDYSQDENNYYKVVRLCLTKFKKSMSPRMLKYICAIIDCGRRRGIDNLDFLFFDFYLRSTINFLPSDDYDVDQAAISCSEVTFAKYITRHGKNCSQLLQGIREYYEELVKYIVSKPISTKEFFKLFERYILHSKINHFGEIIGELNQIRNNSRNAKQYDFINENRPSIFNIALKHLYTQENASHTSDARDLVTLIEIFLGEARSTYKDHFEILKKHVEISKILKNYGLNKYTFKEICRLSELPKWKTYVEFISKLIEEEISTADCGQLLLTLQQNIITNYCSTKAKNVGIFSRGTWKECLDDTKELSVYF